MVLKELYKQKHLKKKKSKKWKKINKFKKGLKSWKKLKEMMPFQSYKDIIKDIVLDQMFQV